ncbi:hypothetical protein COCCADRAFT_83312 [Bipolaris zeicola 26-R-13]|uniref:Uncharacterized protein n=1 Tax=Cochliobolus carbonum (strain 26-R-13) TaxID=930089 RepID=W6YFW8_COCC2|nr:uncharacterized protein COCCADRAFT_83312 [Bipolaris zeicola 26-R-13]EUC38377.1 hypothetical protein COCCADRAFT_83312 [Bipolaris zeicola 26-R-13]
MNVINDGSILCQQYSTRRRLERGCEARAQTSHTSSSTAPSPLVNTPQPQRYPVFTATSPRRTYL